MNNKRNSANMMKRLMKFSVTRAVILMLLLPTVGSLIILSSFYFYLNQTKDDVLFTNVAGRQRMLSEQLGAYAHMVYNMGQEGDREPLRELVANFDNSLAVLDQGSEIMGRRLSPPPAEIQDEIDAVKQLWQDLKPALLLISDQPTTSSQAVKAYNFIKVNIPRLRDLSNEVVFSFELLSHNQKERILWVLITVLSLNFILLLTGIVVIKRYLAERKQTEETLRKSEEKYSTLFELASDAFLTVLLPDGKIIDVNEAAIRMLGYSKEELRKLSGRDIIAPEIFEETECEWQRQVEENGYFLLETIWVHKNDSRFPVEISGKPFELGDQALFQLIGRDITERKRAEDALRNIAEGVSATTGEAFFQSLVQHLSNMLESDYAFVGELDPDETEIIKTIAVYAHGNFVNNFEYKLANTPCKNIVGKQPCMYPKGVQQQFPKDHLLFEMEVESYAGSPLFDSDGNAIGLLVVLDGKPLNNPELVKSILQIFAIRASAELERKRVGEALLESEERYRLVAETATDAIISINEESIILFANPAAEKIFGYTGAEMLGQQITMLMPENLRDAHLTSFKRYIDTGKKQIAWEVVELPGLHKCGKEIPLEISFGEYNEKGKRIFTAIVRDITERRRAEEKIKILSEVVEKSQDMVFITNPNGNIEYVNPAFEKITGYSKEEAVGQTPRILKSGKMSAEYYKNVWDTIQSGKVIRAEIINRKKNGKLFIYNQAITPLKDTDGNIINFVSTGKDVTERVESRKQLEAALDKAEQANRVKSLFLANMSHEIRTPLNSIMGFADLIEMSTRHLIGEEEKGFFDMIKHGGNRLMRTVHEILDISQIEAGVYDLKMVQLDLCKLVKSLIHECQPMVDEKNLKLEYRSDLDSAFIKADRYGVSQAIANIIDNAIKYTEQGKITVSLEQMSEQYVLSIQDTGIGLSEEYIATLFEVFSQESEGYTKRFQGIGLGLALAKRHLDLNQVDINVDSTKGVGTTFTLTFPKDPSDKPVKKHIPEKQVEKEEAQVTPTPEPIEKPLVLLVEDDLGSQKLTEFFLKKEFDTYFAVSVKEAKQQLTKHPVDLILLDLSLIGNEDGLDLVRYLRKTKKWRDIPIIALTAHAFTTDQDNCLTAGCNDYLAKPIKQKDLVEKIKMWLG